jgi:glucan phosphoethanolaminetransferase (alkaline phosphatase superfamily)
MSAARIGVRLERLAASLAVHRRALAAYLLTSFGVVAPFVVHLSDGELRLRADHLWAAVALCALAVISRTLFGLACLTMLAAAVFLQNVERHWGRGELEARLDAMFESTPDEAGEYLQSHLDGIDAMWLVAAPAYALLVFLAVRRFGRPDGLRPAGLAVLVLALGFAALRPGYGMASFPPLALARETAQAQARLSRLSERRVFLADQRLPARDCDIRYDRIVVVIGESATTDHMSVFGYAKPTTPFATRSGAHAFAALSPSNQTRISLAMMLTPAAPGSYEEFFRSHSLVSELRACGFKTTWVSNQGRHGGDDSLASSIAAEADERLFLNEGSWREVQLDGAILDVLASRRVAERRRQATFVHLIGSHSRYEERFPRGFGMSGPGDKVADYDNSILYTDHVLSRLYQRFKGDATLLVYASDHGQVVSNGLFGSGFSPGYQEEFRTPLLVWTADRDAIDEIRAALGGLRLNLESFDDVIRYLAGMTTEARVSTRPTVSVLTPGNVKDYRKLASFAEEQKRGRSPFPDDMRPVKESDQ